MENDVNKKKFIPKVFDYFLQGLLYMAPLVVTLFIIFQIFNYFDSLVQNIIQHLFHFKIPGLGLILLFFFIAIIGYLGQRIIAKPIKVIIEKIISKAPIVQVVYTSIRDFMSAFVGKEKRFTQPVLVKISNNPEIEKMGFLTATDLTDLKIKGKVAVYFPHSYNFSGELLIVPVELIVPLDIHPAEAMKFIVSGGVSKLMTETEDANLDKQP